MSYQEAILEFLRQAQDAEARTRVTTDPFVRAEWARIEIATVRNESYQLPKTRQQFGGLMVCLARQEHPDLSAYNDPEVVWKLDKKQHAGLKHNKS